MCATFTCSKLYQQPLPNYPPGNWTWEDYRYFWTQVIWNIAMAKDISRIIIFRSLLCFWFVIFIGTQQCIALVWNVMWFSWSIIVYYECHEQNFQRVISYVRGFGGIYLLKNIIRKRELGIYLFELVWVDPGELGSWQNRVSCFLLNLGKYS